MRPLIRKHPLLLAAVLALIVLPTPRLALCFGNDGHRAIELLSADCCRPEAGAHDRSEADTGECASDCTDKPVAPTEALGASAPTKNLRADHPCAGDYLAVTPTYRASVPLRPAVGRVNGTLDDGPCVSIDIRRSVLRL